MRLFNGPELKCSKCGGMEGTKYGFSIICVLCGNDGWKATSQKGPK